MSNYDRTGIGEFCSPRYKKRDVWHDIANEIRNAMGMQFSFNQVHNKWLLC